MFSKYVNKLQDAHIKFNIGFFFSNKIIMKDAVILLNEALPKDSYLNHATKLESKGDTDVFIDKIEKTMLSRGIVPAFYLLPKSKPSNLEKCLKRRGYELFCHDAWMMFRKKNAAVRENSSFQIRLAKRNEFATVRHVFNEVFTKGEEDDPYKGLSPVYGDLTLKRLLHKSKDYDSIFFVALVSGKIVGVCNLLYDGKIAAIEGLAVLPKFRNMGIGTSLLLACAKTAQNFGIKDIYLGTEKNSRNEKIFKTIGFHTKMAVKVYCKK